MTTNWDIWDRQETIRIANQAKQAQTAAYIRLNNLYLAIQANRQTLNIHTANELRTLVGQAYPHDQMIDWWQDELCRLPNWNNF